MINPSPSESGRICLLRSGTLSPITRAILGVGKLGRLTRLVLGKRAPT